MTKFAFREGGSDPIDLYHTGSKGRVLDVNLGAKPAAIVRGSATLGRGLARALSAKQMANDEGIQDVRINARREYNIPHQKAIKGDPRKQMTPEENKRQTKRVQDTLEQIKGWPRGNAGKRYDA